VNGKVLKNSELVTFDGCGHGVNSERLEEFNAALLSHFRKAIESSSPSSSSSSSVPLPDLADDDI